MNTLTAFEEEVLRAVDQKGANMTRVASRLSTPAEPQELGSVMERLLSKGLVSMTRQKGQTRYHRIVTPTRIQPSHRPTCR